MTKDELLSLPPAVAIGLIYDASTALQQKLAGVEKPRGPLPPRFDRKVYRKGGFNYASEMSLESLTYWLGKKRDGAASGGEWAQKDAKEASELERWVAYRTWYPDVSWTGTRGDGEVRAAPPSKSPRLHATEPRAPRGDAYEGDLGEDADGTF